MICLFHLYRICFIYASYLNYMEDGGTFKMCLTLTFINYNHFIHSSFLIYILAYEKKNMKGQSDKHFGLWP